MRRIPSPVRAFQVATSITLCLTERFRAGIRTGLLLRVIRNCWEVPVGTLARVEADSTPRRTARQADAPAALSGVEIIRCAGRS